MHRIVTLAGAATIVLASLGTASAAGKCSLKATSGTYMMFNSAPEICLFEMNAKGTVVAGRCYTTDFKGDLGTLSGKLSVSSSCKVTGEIFQKLGKGKVTFNVSAKVVVAKGETSIQGTAKTADGSVKLAAVRQW